MIPSGWLLLVTNLPGRNQALRMRVWRALKAAGAGLLRDGVYLLPASVAAQQLLDEQAAVIQAGGGSAQVLTLTGTQPTAFEAMFERSAEYAAILRRVETFRRSLPKKKEPAARRELAALKRDGTTLVAIDYFPHGGPEQLAQSLASADAAYTAKFSPGEPHPAQRRITARIRRDYQARRWGTRQHLWVDRVCSAWLIKRFIDSKASFVWLAKPSDLPKGAIGFDFDDAEFTHVGDLVTFQVLLASFELDEDEALVRIGQLVHSLDVGGLQTPEASGFTAILSGAQARSADDEALTRAMFPVLDMLHAGFAPDQGQKRQ